MRIRDLNRNGNELFVFADEQGDVYVTINHNDKIYRDSDMFTVRVGGCGSGHEVPSKIRNLLLQLAAEFEKYQNCRYENQAFEMEVKDKNYRI